jgi:hypothetical protein
VRPLTLTRRPNAGHPKGVCGSIPVSGIEVSHEVKLSWTAPSQSTDTVATYNICRVPDGTTSYQPANGNGATETAYTDTAAQSAAQYNYPGKSLDASGKESAPSNVISVTIPSPNQRQSLAVIGVTFHVVT